MNANAICKPSAADLAPLLAEATGHGKIAEAAWRQKLLSGFTVVLQNNPLHYRCFGPYWWLFKGQLIEQGAPFGTTLDAEWVERMDYGAPTLNLLSAYAYYDTAFERGLLLSNVHGIMYVEGESSEYVLIDEDMETLAIGRGL